MCCFCYEDISPHVYIEVEQKRGLPSAISSREMRSTLRVRWKCEYFQNAKRYEWKLNGLEGRTFSSCRDVPTEKTIDL